MNTPNTDVCGLCGKPATGGAWIGDVRYCHGDPDQTFEELMHALRYGQPPSCYEKANGQPGPLAQQWLRGEINHDIPAHLEGSGAAGGDQ